VHCPKCGTNLAIVLADDVDNEDGEADPLATVARRIEAEWYGVPPKHEPRPER
jgi:hypothetical protein